MKNIILSSLIITLLIPIFIVSQVFYFIYLTYKFITFKWLHEQPV